MENLMNNKKSLVKYFMLYVQTQFELYSTAIALYLYQNNTQMHANNTYFMLFSNQLDIRQKTFSAELCFNVRMSVLLYFPCKNDRISLVKNIFSFISVRRNKCRWWWWCFFCSIYSISMLLELGIKTTKEKEIRKWKTLIILEREYLSHEKHTRDPKKKWLYFDNKLSSNDINYIKIYTKLSHNLSQTKWFHLNTKGGVIDKSFFFLRIFSLKTKKNYLLSWKILWLCL